MVHSAKAKHMIINVASCVVYIFYTGFGVGYWVSTHTENLPSWPMRVEFNFL